MLNEAFVYRWRNIETNCYYIGYHKGTPDDGYICSSESVKPAIKANPNRWVRKILRFGTKKDMIKLEQRLFKRLQARTNQRCLNFSNDLPGGELKRPSLDDLRVVGTTTTIWSIKPEWNNFVKRGTGRDFYYFIAEGFLTAVKQRDRSIVKLYLPMIEKVYGVKMEFLNG